MCLMCGSELITAGSFVAMGIPWYKSTWRRVWKLKRWYFPVLCLSLMGCRTYEQRAADEQVHCVYEALNDPRLTPHAQADRAHECTEIYRYRINSKW